MQWSTHVHGISNSEFDQYRFRKSFLLVES